MIFDYHACNLNKSRFLDFFTFWVITIFYYLKNFNLPIKKFQYNSNARGIHLERYFTDCE